MTPSRNCGLANASRETHLAGDDSGKAAPETNSPDTHSPDYQDPAIAFFARQLAPQAPAPAIQDQPAAIEI